MDAASLAGATAHPAWRTGTRRRCTPHPGRTGRVQTRSESTHSDQRACSVLAMPWTGALISADLSRQACPPCI